MRLGLIARADKTGLGNQTRNLAKMLNPSKVLVIDSTPFNGNKQYFSEYKKYNSYLVRGFPSNMDVRTFLRNLDAVVTCELFYNSEFVNIANSMGVRTYNQYNYEFLDNLVNYRLASPTKFLSPSKWMLEEMKRLFPNVEYLPPPIDSTDFADVRRDNLDRSGKRRFLHTVGRQAIHDRNGTNDLINALAYTEADFELVLKVQKTLDKPEFLQKAEADPRVTIDYSAPEDERELYRNFDALILPRRYAGLCLPMNEALMSGLPVIMSDVSPNNEVLPQEWLAAAYKDGSFMARTEINIYSTNPEVLADRIDWLCKTNIEVQKNKAFALGYQNYSMEILLPQYNRILT